MPDLSIYNPNPETAGGIQKDKDYNLDRSVNTFFSLDNTYFGSSYGSFLDVVAPMGGNLDNADPLFPFQTIYCAIPFFVNTDIGFHGTGVGTSFSAPITSGVAALAAEAYYRAHGSMPSPAQLSAIVRKSADDLVGPATDDFWVFDVKTAQFYLVEDATSDKPGQDMRYGAGRVNALKAIEYAQK